MSDYGTRDLDAVIRLRMQFIEWFMGADKQEVLENLAACFNKDSYGFLEVKPRDAAKVLLEIIQNQVEPEEYCTWTVDGNHYHLDNYYINPATRVITDSTGSNYGGMIFMAVLLVFSGVLVFVGRREQETEQVEEAATGATGG